MTTLIAVSALGFISLILEILNLRKILIPVSILGLLATIGLTIAEANSGCLFIADDAHGMIVSSGFAQGFSILFMVLSIFILVMSPAFYKEKKEIIADYVSLKLFMLAGAVAMIYCGSFVMFFLGLEVLSIAAYVLAASESKDIRSNEAGMKYFLMGAFASGFIVFGIALMYGASGTLDLSKIAEMLLAHSSIPSIYYVGFTMLLVGMLFKASIFPFHFWAPDVYDGSPSIVTALMSTLVKVAAIGTLFKLASMLVIPEGLEVIIVLVTILSMTVANITALIQKNIKRMMAYSGVSHAGFMLMAILATDGANILLYYAAAYSLAVMAAFAVIIAVNKEKGNEDIGNFNGLAKRNPLMAVVMSLALLSLAGIPILSGFFAKFFMFSKMFELGYISLVIFGVVNSIISLYYYFNVMNAMFIKEDNKVGGVTIATEYKLVGVIAMALNILIGIFPAIII